MRGQDFIAAAHQQGKVNDVFQFAGITRPRVVFQHLLGGVANQWHREVQALAVDAEEIFGQGQDIPTRSRNAGRSNRPSLK